MSKVSKVLMMGGRNGRSNNDYNGQRGQNGGGGDNRDWERQDYRGDRGGDYRRMSGREDWGDRRNYNDHGRGERYRSPQSDRSMEEEEDYYFKVKGRFGPASMEERQRKDRHELKMDKHMAEEWTEQMKNEDGTAGPHFSMEKVKQIVNQKSELQQFELPEVYAVINMIYSDYCEVAQKLNINNIDFYVCMTKAWLDDKDAGKEKTAKYYEYVVK